MAEQTPGGKGNEGPFSLIKALFEVLGRKDEILSKPQEERNAEVKKILSDQGVTPEDAGKIIEDIAGADSKTDD